MEIIIISRMAMNMPLLITCTPMTSIFLEKLLYSNISTALLPKWEAAQLADYLQFPAEPDLILQTTNSS